MKDECNSDTCRKRREALERVDKIAVSRKGCQTAFFTILIILATAALVGGMVAVAIYFS